MNKQMLATISGLLSFTIGIALAFVLGRHTEVAIRSGEPILCSKYVYSVTPAMELQIRPSQPFEFQEKLEAQYVNVCQTQPYDGMVFWAGTVTGRTNIVIDKSNLNFQTLTGTATTVLERRVFAMPVRPMRIRLKDVTGKARIFQSPSASNGFITIVQVEGNNDVVSFALQWTILR